LTQSALDSYTLNGTTYTQSGTYTQVIPNAAGCDSTITLNLTLSYTGLDELSDFIRIAPNPTSDQLYLTSATALQEDYLMTDAQGRVVLKGTLSGKETTLSLLELAPGTYILRLGTIRVVKVVKQ
jgi:hypothetical protein